MTPDLEKDRSLGPKMRLKALALLGIVALVWNAYVWTTDNPPDLAVVPCLGIVFVAGLYCLSGVDWLQARYKRRQEQRKELPR